MTTQRRAAQLTHSALAGSASIRAAGIVSPHESQIPYDPASIFNKARSMFSIDAEMERAAAVVLKRSTASVVPSPTLLPKETLALSSGGSVRRSSSETSS